MKTIDYLNGGIIPVNASDCLESIGIAGDHVELEDGSWLRSLRDGRFIDDSGNYWAEVFDMIVWDSDEIANINYINRYYKL